MATLKEHLTGRLEFAKSAYVGDLQAMDEEHLTTSMGGSARTPADFTYEVVFLNLRISKRLRGEDPGPYEFKGWMKAPEEFAKKDRIIEQFSASVDEVLNALRKVPEDEMSTKIETPTGDTNVVDLASLAATHISYHDAQLNYIQTMNGDEEMHWN